MGQGYTLHKAHRLVLMEPNAHAAVEAQNGERIHRFGSETDRCRVYRLIAPDSALEQSIIDDQKLQLEHAWMSEYDLDNANAKDGLESHERQQELSGRLEKFVFGDAEEEGSGT